MIALYLIAAVVVIFLIVVALQPAAFTVTRSARLAVPPEKVFPHVNDLHQWEAWSPWAKMDPNSKNSFQGPASGVGAALARLVAFIGFRNSSRKRMRLPGWLSVMVILPSPTLWLPAHASAAPTPDAGP